MNDQMNPRKHHPRYSPENNKLRYFERAPSKPIPYKGVASFSPHSQIQFNLMAERSAIRRSGN